jgi:CRISPR-associated protein Csx3
MDIADRNLLLRELKEQFGQERFDELGEFLLDYVAQRLTDDDADTQDLQEAQEWTALAYTKPDEAARELAKVLSERVKQEDMGEVLRLTSLVEILAEPLVEAGFEPLLVYTNDIRDFLKTDINKATNNLSKFPKHRNQLEINGVIIPIAQKIEINKLERLLPNTPSEIEVTNSDRTDIYSYLMKLEGDVLRVGFNRILPAQSDQIVQDALKQLEQMINSGQIPGGSRILIDGPQSIPVAYVIAHKLAQLYEVIAVFDPSIGRGKHGYKTYIVTITNSQKYRVGDFIETKEPQQSKGSIIKVVLCGPPQSGKSLLRDGLKRGILGNLGAPYPYVITAHSDGEGSWHQEAYEIINEEFAKSIRLFYKGDITPEFAIEAAKWVRSANQLINIIDVKGKISPENKIIMQPATHAVILSGDISKFADWEEFCQSIGLKVIAKIHSQLDGEEDEVFLADNWKEKTNELLEKAPLLTGTVHGLKRGENILTRPMVQALAEVLIHLTQC